MNLLTAEEVAGRCRVSVFTVRRWIKSRQLKAHRAGRAYRVAEEDLEIFLHDLSGVSLEDERRSGQDRRSGSDRRSGNDRRQDSEEVAA